jgi:hypothetical protein
MEKEKTNSSNPILVTGMHRSGTSWVGKMIAASREIAYVSEPLNILHRPGVMRVPTEYWYTYINQNNEGAFLGALNDTIDLKYHFLKEIRSLRSTKDLLRMGRDSRIFSSGRIFRKRALLKDPFAVFSAPWFANRLNCKVVITVRHPAAVVSSLKRLDWAFDFGDLLSQEELMQDWLEPFRDEIENDIKKPQDIIAQASLLWKMIYHVVSQFQESQPGFQIVRHEDLSKDPLQGFRQLYQNLDLDFTQQIEKIIQHSSSSTNPKQLSKNKTHSIRLDSQANLMNWKKRLDPKEISRIRQLTEDTAKNFYSNGDWQ